MKLKIYIIATLLLSSVLWGCRKDDLPVKPQPSPFSASIKAGTATLPAAGGTSSILITAGADGWWIVVPDDKKAWCSITRVYGSGDLEVPVSIKANTTGLPRTVEVAVNPTFNLPAVKLVFNQAGQ
ncbi:BACON domain-containing protein [Mucilaginibacter arboris]|uniref:BACON domain-containing protein n=1 Tax=Mucilaginibacter arboris TaxID=2682090 RepID=A0A7K1ST42_9SPHI|nr:BACON domain-containing protein [Mucilaginibacter arboris]MVN20479.1 hypothetical protein [Mucilaginibacter arboris]